MVQNKKMQKYRKIGVLSDPTKIVIKIDSINCHFIRYDFSEKYKNPH